MSPVRYELGFYIPEDDTLHSHRRANLKSDTIREFENVVLRIMFETNSRNATEEWTQSYNGISTTGNPKYVPSVQSVWR
jgi:hypothetical protein